MIPVTVVDARRRRGGRMDSRRLTLQLHPRRNYMVDFGCGSDTWENGVYCCITDCVNRMLLLPPPDRILNSRTLLLAALYCNFTAASRPVIPVQYDEHHP